MEGGGWRVEGGGWRVDTLHSLGTVGGKWHTGHSSSSSSVPSEGAATLCGKNTSALSSGPLILDDRRLCESGLVQMVSNSFRSASTTSRPAARGVTRKHSDGKHLSYPRGQRLRLRVVSKSKLLPAYTPCKLRISGWPEVGLACGQSRWIRLTQGSSYINKSRDS